VGHKPWPGALIYKAVSIEEKSGLNALLSNYMEHVQAEICSASKKKS
jgi:hypothetical protein